MKKILRFLFSINLVFGFFVSNGISTNAEELKGIKFTADDDYCLTSVITTPRTYEFWIKMDSNAASSRLGTIIGNYGVSGHSSFGIEMKDNGKIGIWDSDGPGPKEDVRGLFDYDLRTGEYTFVAITIDFDIGEANLYINGEFYQTCNENYYDIDEQDTFMIGGDYRSGNAQYLKSSELFGVSLYSDVRTEEEIKNDKTLGNVDKLDVNLQAAFNFTSAAPKTDLSNNNNNLRHTEYSDYDPTTDPDTSGIYFDAENLYQLVGEPFESEPLTFEARIKLKEGMSSRGGIIVGNYDNTWKHVNFEINTNGRPRIYYMQGDKDKTINEYTFNCDVRTTDWVNLAYTYNPLTSEAKVYLDGVLRQTVSLPHELISGFIAPFGLGGDARSGNEQYFKGKIASVTMWKTTRTLEEIKSDFTSINNSDSNLIAHYNLANKQGVKNIQNLANDKYNFKMNKDWLNEDEISHPTNYSYSFAIIGDTQIVNYKYPNELETIFDYIIDNKESKNIKFVMSMGDTTDKDTIEEWSRAREQYLRLEEEEIPYSMVRGNHDSSSKFNQIFNDDTYGYFDPEIEYCYDDSKIENTVRFLSIGDVDYMIFTLDYGASNAVLNWAAGLIEDYCDYRVIITTHAYLYRDGTTLDEGDVCPPSKSGGYNNGDDIWDKLVSQYENIELVICGHDPCNDVIVAQDKGVNDNTVTQILVDPQGIDVVSPKGMVCMLYFSEDGNVMDIEWYSTVKEQYYGEKNQQHIVLHENQGGGEDPDPIDPSDTSESTIVSEEAPISEETSIQPSEEISITVSEERPIDTSEDTPSQNVSENPSPTPVSEAAPSEAPASETPETSEEKKGGCGGSITATCGLIAILASIGTCFVLKKRKQN